ncbi:hypothetical protein LIER_19060 [Lithospermum erythrorhizon]|uniref:Uncharacterized protein n=1 Tax=Lithospermum erythrorhizon TaxID=34254 RepID=A0AAV3QIY3_LITER
MVGLPIQRRPNKALLVFKRLPLAFSLPKAFQSFHCPAIMARGLRVPSSGKWQLWTPSMCHRIGGRVSLGTCQGGHLGEGGPGATSSGCYSQRSSMIAGPIGARTKDG